MDKYKECPLKAAGFRLVDFVELPTMIIGPDGMCICTENDRCRDVDKRDGKRCTLEQLKSLDSVASARRGWQSGSDW